MLDQVGTLEKRQDVFGYTPFWNTHYMRRIIQRIFGEQAWDLISGCLKLLEMFLGRVGPGGHPRGTVRRFFVRIFLAYPLHEAHCENGRYPGFERASKYRGFAPC